MAKSRVFNGKRLKTARVYRAKTIDPISTRN